MGRSSKSGTTCCIPGRHHNNMRNRNISWQIFPKDSHLQQLWIQAIVEKAVLPQSWEPKPSYKVCGCHFHPSGTREYMDKVPQLLEPGTFSVVTNEAAGMYLSVLRFSIFIFISFMPMTESPTEVIAAAAEPMPSVLALSLRTARRAKGLTSR
ncbi:zinc finger protein 184-like [Ixodes scapularis]